MQAPTTLGHGESCTRESIGGGVRHGGAGEPPQHGAALSGCENWEWYGGVGDSAGVFFHTALNLALIEFVGFAFGLVAAVRQTR